MYSKLDFNIDDQVSFIYDAGSRPGAVRIVDVTKVTDTHIRGYDHYRDEERTFSYIKIRDGSLKYYYHQPQSTICGVIDSSIDSTCFDIYNNESILFVIRCRNNGTVSINGIEIQTIDDLRTMVAEIAAKIGK